MNPYLPLYEYIPDGEPHVFGDRVYIYGSHDKFDGEVFCQNDYVSYSASTDNLQEWKYEGVIYKKSKDPRNKDLEGLAMHCLWAPDVVQGLDGRYYLYYCMDVLPEIGVAVCDTPAGEYEYLGLVKHKDGIPLGRKEGDYVQFDPGLFIDEDRTIYLYSGNAPRYRGDNKWNRSQVMTLEEDMLTLKTEPRLLLPTINESKGTPWEGHEFFEASSVRKINGTYYFIYSDVKSNFLSYAMSNCPDRDFSFAGPILSLGDVEYHGRTAEKARNFLGNTHGSIECIKGQWYVFYHRQTNRHLFSRQACAEKLEFEKDGKIKQACMTSLGFASASLPAKGTYSAAIACNLWGKRGIYEHRREKHEPEDYPYFTQSGEDRECNPDSYIANMQNGAVAGYKYFEIEEDNVLTLEFWGEADGYLSVFAEKDSAVPGENGISKETSCKRMAEDRSESGNTVCCAKMRVLSDGKQREKVSCKPALKKGNYALYIEYSGTGMICLRELSFGEGEPEIAAALLYFHGFRKA